ncbi:MFS general substrate transporter [Glarea lozoyensis ATCC 20868]|uniref:MFS general substrate transporter n=1 Tax=Glarea lozoyensis (strain ATCC 20868 / MF5171) TaxID=1116229 RepID=S3CP16_GLAL2|nr:MFS general substrate transporter [Glarea lozoyensis ATCC 20868]EPE26904.1 MFS general substrate transporter [Glarea lozoyensis ATCC 20868]
MSGIANRTLNGSDETTNLLPESPKSPAKWDWKTITFLCIVLCITFDIGDYLIQAPRLRLYESIICDEYYSTHNISLPQTVPTGGPIPEQHCKLDEIQDELAMIQGWQVAFDSISSILLAVPYGWVADKYGRKLVITAALGGCIMAYVWTLLVAGWWHLPLRWVWVSSIFLMIGGGNVTATTMASTIVADVAPLDMRSTAFLYRFTSDLVAECLTPPIASMLMTKSVWIPLLAALGFELLGYAFIIPLPETLPQKTPEDTAESSRSSEALVEEEEQRPLLEADESDPKKPSRLSDMKESFSFLTRDKAVAALVFTFLVSKVGRQSTNLIIQYVSKRYHWSIAKAGLLLSLRAAVNIILFLLVLPAISTYAFPGATAAFKDLTISRVSILLMIFGTLVLSVSPTPALMIIGLVIYTLGTGFVPVVRSLITSLAESHHASKTSDVGRLYAIIGVMESIGSLLAGPGMAIAFRLGMKIGQAWLGLPFLVASALFGSVAGVVFWVKV